MAIATSNFGLPAGTVPSFKETLKGFLTVAAATYPSGLQTNVGGKRAIRSPRRVWPVVASGYISELRAIRLRTA